VSKRSRRKARSSGQTISWERARAIFGNPEPPDDVWEQQFDDINRVLRRLARTPYDEIDFSDLSDYYHDLAYVELQPDLFEYLFPVCLMDWHDTLMKNEECSHGEPDFHYGVHCGKVFEKMLSPQQQHEVVEFLRDSFLERLDNKRGFLCEGRNAPALGWISRFNSFGLILPRIDALWDSWWTLETPGRAVAALEYCSGLMYLEWGNPLFEPWTRERRGRSMSLGE